MAILRNAHQVAEEMGNSVAMVRRHYDAVLEPSKAAAWWENLPERSRKRCVNEGSRLKERLTNFQWKRHFHRSVKRLIEVKRGNGGATYHVGISTVIGDSI